MSNELTRRSFLSGSASMVLPMSSAMALPGKAFGDLVTGRPRSSMSAHSPVSKSMLPASTTASEVTTRWGPVSTIEPKGRQMRLDLVVTCREARVAIGWFRAATQGGASFRVEERPLAAAPCDPLYVPPTRRALCVVGSLRDTVSREALVDRVEGAPRSRWLHAITLVPGGVLPTPVRLALHRISLCVDALVCLPPCAPGPVTAIRALYDGLIRHGPIGYDARDFEEAVHGSSPRLLGYAVTDARPRQAARRAMAMLIQQNGGRRPKSLLLTVTTAVDGTLIEIDEVREAVVELADPRADGALSAPCDPYDHPLPHRLEVAVLGA